jgi:rRNA processing protein Gar1
MSNLLKRLSNFTVLGGTSSPHGSVLCEYLDEFKKLDTENNRFITGKKKKKKKRALQASEKR